MKGNKDLERARLLKDLLVRLETEEDRDAIQEDFNKNFGTVSAQEIAAAEQLLMEEGTQTQEIGELCKLHATMFEDAIEKVDMEDAWVPGHPMGMIEAENIGLEKFLTEIIRPLVRERTSEKGLLDGLVDLRKVLSHYDKKDNLLFPYLEQAGITGPSTVMWENETKNKRALSKAIRTLKQDELNWEELENLIEDLEGMISLEREILTPMVMEHISAEDWVLIAEDALDMGYVFLDGQEGYALSDANTWILERKGMAPELATPGEIKLPTGSFTNRQLRAVLNNMDLDITVIDADDKVIYYNEMKPRYFSRTRSIIGRDLDLCHPPQVLPMVRKLVDDLKSKKRTEASFSFPQGERLLLAHYVGLYDGDEYIGCLERVQDLRPLEEYFGERPKVAEEKIAPSARLDATEEDIANPREITLNMKLNTLLKEYPEAFDLLLSLSPAYKKLTDPVMRKTMGTVASIKMIAGRGGYDPEELLAILKEKLEK